MTDRSRCDSEREARWRKILGEQSRSGLGQRQFCERRGLSVSTFQYWKRRLLESSDGGAAWVEYSVESPEVANMRSATWECEIELPDGVVVRVSPGSSVERVWELVMAASVR